MFWSTKRWPRAAMIAAPSVFATVCVIAASVVGAGCADDGNGAGDGTSRQADTEGSRDVIFGGPGDGFVGFDGDGEPDNTTGSETVGGDTSETDTVRPGDPDVAWDTSPSWDDEDGDGVPDETDNCVGLFNPLQRDADQDGIGDPCDPEGGDADGDGVPDQADLWPDNGQMPGTVLPNTVYAHTSGALYRLGVKTHGVHLVATFKWPSGVSSREMTDIAIDRYGVLYGITFDELVTCHPGTAQCTRLASLPSQFNGLTLVPRNVLGTEVDSLVAISSTGDWWHMKIEAGSIYTAYLGAYGGVWKSSGDAFSIEGVGTFASVNKNGAGSDFLVEVNPATGAVIREVASFGGYGSIYGLAGWQEDVFAFDASGDILVYDIATGTLETTLDGDKVWWGAGVSTRLIDAPE